MSAIKEVARHERAHERNRTSARHNRRCTYRRYQFGWKSAVELVRLDPGGNAFGTPHALFEYLGRESYFRGRARLLVGV